MNDKDDHSESISRYEPSGIEERHGIIPLWLAIVYAITLVCCPALSLPCGFTASGLPVGLQMVAAPRGEAQLLAGAKLLEDILGMRGTTPIDPRLAR